MMTKKDILLLMAVDLGVADYPDTTDNTPTLPADTATLLRLRNGFENGRRTFYDEDPKFAFTRPSIQVTLDPTGAAGIDGDAGRYALDAGIVAPPLGVVTFSYPSGAGYGGDVQVTSWARVNTLRAMNPTATGRPQLVAFHPRDAGDAEDQVWEMRTYPPLPDQAYVLEATFKRECVPLSDDNVTEPSGYPLAVKAYAVWEVQKANPIRTGPTQERAEQDKNEWLERVVRQERAKTPRTLGRSVHQRYAARRNRQFPLIEVTLQDGSLLSESAPAL